MSTKTFAPKTNAIEMPLIDDTFLCDEKIFEKNTCSSLHKADQKTYFHKKRTLGSNERIQFDYYTPHEATSRQDDPVERNYLDSKLHNTNLNKCPDDCISFRIRNPLPKNSDYSSVYLEMRNHKKNYEKSNSNRPIKESSSLLMCRESTPSLTSLPKEDKENNSVFPLDILLLDTKLSCPISPQLLSSSKSFESISTLTEDSVNTSFDHVTNPHHCIIVKNNLKEGIENFDRYQGNSLSWSSWTKLKVTPI